MSHWGDYRWKEHAMIVKPNIDWYFIDIIYVLNYRTKLCRSSHCVLYIHLHYNLIKIFTAVFKRFNYVTFLLWEIVSTIPIYVSLLNTHKFKFHSLSLYEVVPCHLRPMNKPKTTLNTRKSIVPPYVCFTSVQESEVHRMTPKWPWIIQGQRYRLCVLLISGCFSEFHSTGNRF